MLTWRVEEVRRAKATGRRRTHEKRSLESPSVSRQRSRSRFQRAAPTPASPAMFFRHWYLCVLAGELSVLLVLCKVASDGLIQVLHVDRVESGSACEVTPDRLHDLRMNRQLDILGQEGHPRT